jgi:hypothetical protein
MESFILMKKMPSKGLVTAASFPANGGLASGCAIIVNKWLVTPRVGIDIIGGLNQKLAQAKPEKF